MNIKSIVKLTLVFSACFLSAAVVGIAALNKGFLSPRGFGIFLAVMCLGGFVLFVVGFRRLARKDGAQRLPADVYAVTRERRILLIRIYKAWILVLGLCLVGGTVKGIRVHPIPLFPMLVGITMNLLTTWVLVLAVRKLQRSLK